MPSWRDYEEDAARLFRDLNMNAEVQAEVTGARGKHEVDVLVTFQRIGITHTWIIECKHRGRPVEKLHALALSEIIQDVGADRGFLLSESGFQSGAIRSSATRNITLTSLEDLRAAAADEIASIGLQEAWKRIALLRERLREADALDRSSTPGTGHWVASDENLKAGGPLTFAAYALAEVWLGHWPLLYGADVVQDRGLWANNAVELADGLHAVLDAVEVEVAGVEAALDGRGPTGLP